MADISAFPTLATLLEGDNSIILTPLGPAKKFTLAADVKAGQTVAFTSTSGQVTPTVGATSEVVAGVVESDGDSGDEILVYLAGNIANLTNASTSVTIEGGTWVKTDDNAVKGTISALTLTPSGATATMYLNVVGIALEDIVGSSFGKVLIMPVPITVANAS